MPRVVIILSPGSAIEQRKGVVKSLPELGKTSSVFVELVLIETPNARLGHDERVATFRLEELDRVHLSSVEARSDRPSGLVEATNEALRRVRQAKLDAIVVGPRIVFDRDAVLRLCAVGEEDPMAGFVEASVTEEDNPAPDAQPRSLSLTYQRALEDMPRLSYVPLLEVPLVLIKSRMLQEFGLLDCVFKSMTAALNDLTLRANRCGYRVVRANYARVTTTIPGVGDDSSDERDAAILRARFPYLAEEIARYENGPDVKVRKLLEGLRPDAQGKLNIVFACNNLGKIHNGTSELATRVITEFSLNHSGEYNIHVLCSAEAFDFHEYGELSGVVHLSGLAEQVEKPFFASIRLVQPFADEEIALLANQAPVTMVLMLDTIAVDCMQITPGLARIWERMRKSVSAVGFISDFSRAQFDRRFSHQRNYLAFTALCSTQAKEYGCGEKAGAPQDDGYVLLVGNSYEHKFLQASCEIFRHEAPETKLVILGFKMADDEHILSFESGQLSDEAAADLYVRASLVFFPSHCEGFGLPIMHSLAKRKPVIARELPVFREIRERVRDARNLYLFETTAEMVRFAMTRPAWDDREVEPIQPVQCWADMAKSMCDALVEAGARLTYAGLRDRLLEAEACREIARLEAIGAGQAREIAEMKLVWEPPVAATDVSGQAARFAAKRLESRLRRFFAWRWAYSVTRFGWRVIRKSPE